MTDKASARVEQYDGDMVVRACSQGLEISNFNFQKVL